MNTENPQSNFQFFIELPAPTPTPLTPTPGPLLRGGGRLERKEQVSQNLTPAQSWQVNVPSMSRDVRPRSRVPDGSS